MNQRILFIESILASIEVKSTLNANELKDIIEKSLSIWRLVKSPYPDTPILPGMALSTSYLPVQCIGLCFKSEIPVDNIIPKIRNIQSENNYENALSILCVLQDNNGKSALIVNVFKNRLDQISLLPTSDSHLALVKLDDPGDALLQLYLLIMENLRYSGFVSPGPNLLHYAKLAGLAIQNLTSPRTELDGTSFEFKGETFNYDDLMLLQDLDNKVMNKKATETEILSLLLIQSKSPLMKDSFTQNCYVFFNKQLTKLPSVPLVCQSVARYLQGHATDDDNIIVREYLRLMHLIGIGSSNFISICTINN